MRDRLQALAAQADHRSPFAAEARIDFLRQIPEPPDVRTRTLFDVRLAVALLQAGKTQEAIDLLSATRDSVAEHPSLFRTSFIDNLDRTYAVSQMRLGEELNCLHGSEPLACLYPLRGGGVHDDSEPATKALRVYLDLVQRNPGDIGLTWLSNLAAMASGTYPEAVPEALRIADRAFASETSFEPFPNIAGPARADVSGLSGGVVAEDLDGDGRLDLMVSSWGILDPLRLLISDGSGSFIDRTHEAGLAGITGGLNLLHADYDNDGDADVLVLRGAWLGPEGLHPNSLLRNRGDGHFDDVTEEAGLLDFHPTQTAAWSDFDGDGWLDLFVGNETLPGGQPHPCRLFRNRGDGTFEDLSRAAGLDLVGFVKAVVAGDFDGDGRQDLYVSRLGQPNLLLQNLTSDGRLQFRDIAAEAAVALPLGSFPTWFFDFDQDGDLDLFVSGYWSTYEGARVDDAVADSLGLEAEGERARLYRNRGDGTFEDVSVEAGLSHIFLAMGANFGDLDNDGWPDFYLGTGAPSFDVLLPNRMFLNDGAGHFDDVSSAGGFGHLQKGHGVAFADLDDDGDQDLYAVMGGAYAADVARNVLFENPGHDAHWLTLRLQGVRANRSAIGARIEVQAATRDDIQRSFWSWVGTGGSFGSSSLQVEMGLGPADRVHRVIVDWPSPGIREVFEGIQADGIWSLREGSGNAIAIQARPFSWSGGDSVPIPHHHTEPTPE
ncbi:MAG: CRTAC1 family protein [Thermoanaerobaculia bacterium]|nr:CRTAC1 family protein [Thermoanaerobaculia bacterium]